ncbi:HNH endonuclease family protein [uncultured Thiodictyon sp.]|jgi:hypothetical protein|uniref:HNH endonuclease family protein n=1 Tax=uncultured Thiodictyon sp. TaxID=1846217 RepID=UPI0025D3B974|nr:HNH endonuclease family protein [uncultured Thiodictyon sp.]
MRLNIARRDNIFSARCLDDAFRLFTILNDRGIPLSNSDILKAKNLGEISSDKECSKWATYWEEVEGELGRDEFDRFLSLVRTIYVKDKAREGLLKEFDERIYGAKPRPLLALGTATFEAVKAYKDAFDTSILFDNLPVSVGNAYRNRINVMRRGLPSTDWVPPVLAWYRKFGVTKLLEFVERVDNKFSADWIMQLTPSDTSQWVRKFTQSEREIWRHRLGNLMLLSRRKNASLGNLDFAAKKTRYFESRVESLPNSQRVLILNRFASAELQARHQDLIGRLQLSY